MRAILAHSETNVYGQRTTIVLEYDAILYPNGLHVVPGSTVSYRVSDGTHTITGHDLHAAYLGNVTGTDMLRSLASFLSADHEHVQYGHHSNTERCPEYGAGCPMYRAEYVAALDAMSDVLQWVSMDPDDSDDHAAECPTPVQIDDQDRAALTYAVKGAGPIVNHAALTYAGLA